MKKILHIVAVLGITGLLCGFSLTYVYQATKVQIAKNEEERLQKALKVVMPAATVFENKSVPGWPKAYYLAYDEQKNLVGYIAYSVGSGYQGSIKIMIGIDAKLEKLCGIYIFPNNETPGLGARITEDQFRKQFTGLAPYPQVNVIKGRAPSNANEIQAITGATISSHAVVGTLNRGMGYLLHEIAPEQFSKFDGLSSATFFAKRTSGDAGGGRK